MAGRALCSEEQAIRSGFGGWECARRREVLLETIAAFEQAAPADRYHCLAEQNLDRWRADRLALASDCKVEVYPDDWGEGRGNRSLV